MNLKLKDNYLNNLKLHQKKAIKNINDYSLNKRKTAQKKIKNILIKINLKLVYQAEVHQDSKAEIVIYGRNDFLMEPTILIV